MARRRRSHGRLLYYPRALERIARYNSDMKVIVSLRNPVERAFSQWNMRREKRPGATGIYRRPQAR